MISETNKQQFLILAKKFEALKDELKTVGDQMAIVMGDIGLGVMFQDDETGAVYRIREPKGTFVEYRKIGYQRTAMGDEASGDVSKKDAEAAGFVLRK